MYFVMYVCDYLSSKQSFFFFFIPYPICKEAMGRNNEEIFIH